MVQCPKKMLLVGLMALAGLFCASSAEGAIDLVLPLQPRILNHTGIYGVREIEPSLRGSGVRFAVISRSITYSDGDPLNDYRPYVLHESLKDKRLAFVDDGVHEASISPHSTAICSILLGEDRGASDPELGSFHYQGVAPDAEADVYELCYFVADHVFPQIAPDSDVVSLSLGVDSEDWWTRGIESLIEHEGMVVVASIGNGLDANDPPLYPGACANTLGVGVIDTVDSNDLAKSLANLALAYPDHSSFGPTVDGRCKPDLVAPGNCLAANANEPDLYEPTGSWASFSTPIAAGAAGLLVQKAGQDANLASVLSPDGGNCVVKVLLMNSATKLPYWHKGHLTTDDDHTAPLDHIQGAGMLNSKAAYELMIAGEYEPGVAGENGWDLNKLEKDTQEENAYKIKLDEPAGKVVTATVAWNHHYGKVYPFAAKSKRNANIRLELWAIDSENPEKTYLLDYSDSSVDNVEHLSTAADPNYNEYEIVVSYSDADKSVTAGERYAVAWSVGESSSEKDTGWYDLNGDGVVNTVDLLDVLIVNCLASQSEPEGYFIGDVNSDGRIDGADIQLLMGQLEQKAPWVGESK